MLSLLNQACHHDIMKVMCLACNGMRHAANVPLRLSNMRLLFMVLKKTTPPTAATEAEAMQVQAVWLAKAISMCFAEAQHPSLAEPQARRAPESALVHLQDKYSEGQ
jgi:hypothetical protein